jgi:Arrestin (or S-antigen), N-terminal domain
MVNCVVSFSNNSVFQSGQEVTGSVILYNEKPRMVRAIVLKVEGFCSTSWTESSGMGNDSKSTTYSAREDYINTTSILTGNGRGNFRQ